MVFEGWAAEDLHELTDLLDAAQVGAVTEEMLSKHVSKHGTGVNIDGGGATLLHFLAKGGQVDMCQYFIEKGGAVDPRSETGATPLDEACSFGSYQAAKYLIAKGANVNNQTDSGYTPLMRAAFYGSDDLIDRLRDSGADRSIACKAGKTALDYAVEAENHRCADLLMKEKTPLDVLKEIDYASWMTNAGSDPGVCKVAKLVMRGLQHRVVHGWGSHQSVSIYCMAKHLKEDKCSECAKDSDLVLISQLEDHYEI